MKINHRENFFEGFAYDLGGQGACMRNILRATAYVPVLGPGFQLFCMAIVLSSEKKTPDDWGIAAAFAGRAVLAIPGPVLLPIVDLIATIWKENCK